MFIYLLERILRIYRASLPVSILSISLMDDVLSLEFAKEGIFETESYKEGQYLFLQSPPISRIQWHPFTISSAPQENSVTVHIRVMGEGTWTRGVMTYMSSMGARGKNYIELDRLEASGKVKGKRIGPDGNRIICLDGPHCLLRGTEVRLSDGHSARCEELVVGAVLAGYSGPVTVTAVGTGVSAQMVRVTDVKGRTYTVTPEHQLTLRAVRATVSYKSRAPQSSHLYQIESLLWFDRHTLKEKEIFLRWIPPGAVAPESVQEHATFPTWEHAYVDALEALANLEAKWVGAEDGRTGKRKCLPLPREDLHTHTRYLTEIHRALPADKEGNRRCEKVDSSHTVAAVGVAPMLPPKLHSTQDEVRALLLSMFHAIVDRADVLVQGSLYEMPAKQLHAMFANMDTHCPSLRVVVCPKPGSTGAAAEAQADEVEEAGMQVFEEAAVPAAAAVATSSAPTALAQAVVDRRGVKLNFTSWQALYEFSSAGRFSVPLPQSVRAMILRELAYEQAQKSYAFATSTSSSADDTVASGAVSEGHTAAITGVVAYAKSLAGEAEVCETFVQLAVGAAGSRGWRPVQPGDRVDVLHLLHTPMQMASLLNRKGKKAQAILRIEETEAALSIQPGAQHGIAISVINPIAWSTGVMKSALTNYDELFSRTLALAFNLQPKVIIVYGEAGVERVQMQQIPGLTRKRRGTDNAPSLFCTYAGGEEIEVILSPHPAARNRYPEVLRAIAQAHRHVGNFVGDLPEDAMAPFSERIASVELLEECDGFPFVSVEVDGDHRYVLGNGTLTHNSAPTQHVGEYSTVIVVGAGIGATPVSSTLKSIVFHKWRVNVGQCFPEHAYFAWVCAHRDIDAFRWLIRTIREAQDEIVHQRQHNSASMSSKTFEFHIFLTSAPKNATPVEVVVDDEVGFWGPPREANRIDKVRCNWDEITLYKAMKCPAKHTQLGDVHVWEGRPKWSERFAAVAAKHDTQVGVTFCGNPLIAKDLRKQCYITNKTRGNDVLFKLHKENF